MQRQWPQTFLTANEQRIKMKDQGKKETATKNIACSVFFSWNDREKKKADCKPQMEVIVSLSISWKIFFATRAVLKIGEYLTIIPQARVGYEMIDSPRGA